MIYLNNNFTYLQLMYNINLVYKGKETALNNIFIL